MRILITGGTGFIGSNIIKELVKRGHEVTATGINVEAKIPKIAKFLNLHLEGINWKYVYGMDAIFHEAANNDTLDMDEEEMWKANVGSSIKLFNMAQEGGCKKYVYASSTAVYGDAPAPYIEDFTKPNPLNPYGQSKLRLDKFCMEFGKEGKSVIGLRYCNVYGPGEEHKGCRSSMIYQLAKQMMNGKRPKLFRDGEQKRDWIYVKDVVKANMLAMEKPVTNVFNCGSGEAVTFNELVKLLNKHLKTNLEPEYIDNPYKKTYQIYTKCDMSKAKKKLGFVPEYDIDKGIAEYVCYLKEKPGL